MTAKKKYKPMTIAQKKYRKELKQKLIADGVIPPPKKPLNRKKFCKNVHAEWESRKGGSYFSLREALGWMVPSVDTKLPITEEEVGVLKLVMIALQLEKFWENKQSEGKSESTVQEVYDVVVKPILDL